MRPRTVGCLFDGIHGFGLGLAAAGAFRAAWTVEFADFPHELLRLRVPDAEHLRDVRDVKDPPRVDWLTGGFPCQDLSLAGRGAGIAGSRSGLWTEYARIIGEVEPEVVLIENVPALLHRGMELVVENLVELGYGVEWDCMPAAAFGAPHLRDRVWIVAHRLGVPVVFGQPAALFATAPGEAVAVVGGDDDDDDDAALSGWMRWPRAGWVHGDPSVVMPLQPLAPRAAVGHLALVPTPTRSDGTGGPGNSGRAGGDNLRTYVARAPWPTPLSVPSSDDSHGQVSGTFRAAMADRGVRGPLNPPWVEYLMSFPLGWTDPDVPNDELEHRPWSAGDHGIPRTLPGVKHRKHRLAALGNALVPAAPAWIAARYIAALEREQAA